MITPTKRSRSHPQRRGFSILYLALIMMILFAFASFAVDYGRVEVARTELRTAADAASRYACTGLNDGTWLAKACAAAAENNCLGQPVTLQASDVIAGTWAKGIFTPGGNSPNAVQVQASRLSARGTGIGMIFARVLGMNQFDLSVTSIAKGADAGYGFVGLNSATLTGNSVIDSYNSSKGAYSSGARGDDGSLASNGSITLNGNVQVYGDISYGTSYNGGGGGPVSPGKADKLNGTLTYPSPTLPPSFINQGGFNGAGNDSLTLTSGNYFFNSFKAAGNFTVNIAGQVNLYVAGDVQLAGNFNIQGNLPGNFVIHVTQPASVKLAGNSALYADIDAPTSSVDVVGNSDVFGRIVSASLTVHGNAGLHYDQSLAQNPAIVTVK